MFRKDGMSNYTVAHFAQTNGLIVVGSLSLSDPRLQAVRRPLMMASFTFPSSVRTLALYEIDRATVSALLYSEQADDILEVGPGSLEPNGLVEFNAQTGEAKAYVLLDEPLLKAILDGKRRAWRERHAQRH